MHRIITYPAAAPCREPSLCTGWSVHEVLGHITATARMTRSGSSAGWARAGFRFETMARRNIDAETAGGPAATLARFRQAQNRSSGPPGPVDSSLGETLVHAEDIRRPAPARGRRRRRRRGDGAGPATGEPRPHPRRLLTHHAPSLACTSLPMLWQRQAGLLRG